MNGFLVKAFPPINASSNKKKYQYYVITIKFLENGDLDSENTIGCLISSIEQKKEISSFLVMNEISSRAVFNFPTISVHFKAMDR